MTEAILVNVRRIAADLLDIPFEQVLPTSSPDTVENWDSLRHLNLVLGLEGDFGVQFSPEEIAAMQTIERIALLLHNKLSKTE